MKFSLKNFLVFSLAVSGTNAAFAGNGTPPGNGGNGEESDKRVGYASYYHDKFHGRKTANGEIYNKTLLSAAHRTLPMGSLIRVKRLDNGKTVMLRVNDRGPYSNYMVDLSRAAAAELGLVGIKRKVEIQVINTKPTQDDLLEAENSNTENNNWVEIDEQQPPVITAESELQRAGGRARATKAAAAGEAVVEENTERRGRRGGRKGRHARGGKHGGKHSAKAARSAKRAGGRKGGKSTKRSRRRR